jgi:hypothetical protein
VVTPDSPRRPARDLIDAVLDNMRQNLEPLKYSTLAPSRFVVYLHPSEYSRIEGIVPVLQAQTIRALDEELARLNNPGIVRRYASRVVGAAVPVENAAREWQIEFAADADGEVNEGDVLIHSELVLPGADVPGVGQRTRRIATVHIGGSTTVRERAVTETHPASSRVTARLRYDDDSGPHTFEIARDVVSIGRGGLSHRVDVRIESAVDVSREHARIRRDGATGKFFLTDLSLLGTTMNGRRVPAGFTDAGGARKENGLETELPDGARIGLAGTIFLDFELIR